MNLVIASKCDAVRDALHRDKLDIRPFVLMAYSWAWVCPELGYQDILSAYADYVGDAPERVHADLCYRLLTVGKEIGPEQYLEEIRKEVVGNDYRVFAE